MKRRLPWLIVLIAVLGAAFLLYDTVGDLIGVGLLRSGGGPEEEADEYEEALEALWDEAPRLAGSRNARAPVTYETTGPEGGSLAAGSDGAAGASGGIPLVRFGGLVKGTDGRPATGVRLTMVHQGGGKGVSFETDAAGRFDGKVRAGRYDLEMRGEGVGGLRFADYVVDGASGGTLEFTLKRTHRLVVRLRHLDQGLAAARLSVTPRGGAGAATAVTDEAGEAIFEALIEDTYALKIETGEHGVLQQQVRLQSDADVKITLPKGVVLQGIVTSGEDGNPVPGATVEASIKLPSGGTWVTISKETDATGTYTMEVPKGKPGRFEITADTFAPWPPRRQIRRVLKSLGGLSKGRKVTRNVQLTRGFYVSGRVTDTDGKPVAQMDLELRRRRGGLGHKATTDEDGEYEVAGVSNEPYDFVIVSEGWFTERALVLRVPKLQPGETHTQDVTVHEALRLEGEVVHAKGKPAAGARVWVTARGRLLRAAHDAGRVLETFSDANGWWRLTDLPPNMGIKICAELGTLEASPRGVNTGALPEKPPRLLLRPTVTVKGKVFDAASRTLVANARVTLSPVGKPGGRTGQNVVTDAEGTFTALELVPGAWQLKANKVGYLAGEVLEEVLGEDDEVVEVTLYLDPGLPIGGTVTDLQGRPLKNVKITVAGTTTAGTKVVRRAPNTKADGRFRITGFEPGSYRVVGKRAGYRNGVVKDLRGGEAGLQLVLRPKAP